MPRGDRTGPMGSGPMTGWGVGLCGGYGRPGYFNAPGAGYGAGWGRGFGRGRGLCGGRGFRHQYWASGLPGWTRFGWGMTGPWATPTPEVEQRVLEDQIQVLQAELDEVRKRLNELSQPKDNVK